MTNRELSQAIVQTMKEAGIKRSAFRVQTSCAGYDQAAHVTLLDKEINRRTVDDLMRPLESFECDQFGEILAGGSGGKDHDKANET